MEPLTSRTLRNGGIGAVVGVVLGFVPLVLLVAPLLGGGVAGFLERRGPKQGAIAGGVAGALMAVLSALVVAVIVAVRFGEISFLAVDAPLRSFGIATALSVVASVGQILIAAIGGGLGGILEADRRRVSASESTAAADNRISSALRVGGSLLVGLVTFAIVALAVTAALDPFIWPSALVGLPAGLVAGAAVSVVGYHYLTRRNDPESDVNWRAIGAGTVGIAVVFALVIGGLLLLGDQRMTETTESTYQYDVTVAADGTIENATFYVPLPVDAESGSTELGEQFVEEVRYDRHTPPVDGYEPSGDPVEFNYELVETDHGPMLAISTARIDVTQVYYRTVENETMGWHERIPPEEYDPDDPSMGVQDDGSFRFSVTMAANDTIDTADPFGSEPLLTPKFDLQETDCRYPSETARCYEYDSLVYASYETGEETTVYVAAELAGYNEWFSGGWSGNEYREWTHVELVGPHSGWIATTGELDVGDGSYR